MTKRAFILLLILGFCAMWQRADAQITLGKPKLEAPFFGIEEEIVNVSCKLDEIPTDEIILYKLFKEDNLNKLYGEYSAHRKEKGRFLIYVQPAHDGWFICQASVQNNSEITPTFSDKKRFHVLLPIAGVEIISNQSLEDLWEGESLTLQCDISKGTFVFYTWIRDNLTIQNETSDKQLHIPILTKENSGEYFCLAENIFNDTVYFSNMSAGRNVHVKENLSSPEISFNVLKDAKGNFNARVNCEVKKGSLPINFTLFRNNQNVDAVISQHQNVTFVVPIVLDQDMGTVYCQASNGEQPVQSKKLNLTVESLEGTVTIRLEKVESQDLCWAVLGVYMYCEVKNESFLQFQWFFNNKRLEKFGTFHRIYYEDNSGISVRLNPHGASDGFYHCEVFTPFNNTKKLRSSKEFRISYEAFNKIPTNVAVIVFTLFSLLICAVFACCIYGVVLRKMKARKYIFRVKDFPDMHSVIDDDDDYNDDTEEIEEDKFEEVEHEDLDTEAYIEDIEVVQASMMEDFEESEEEKETDVDNYNF
ncbi:hypothetical protein HF521_022263 [Silurus meridionalis]|uniref:Ig-like domain-containing protein n=2 Tax=Silurus meridionalis TaxID=175797 RepID=A0A8T0BD36_SILME|nr:hypothetical protein HF521_022263 [Silurus meridionalis]